MGKKLYDVDEVLADIFKNENLGTLIYSNIESDDEYDEEIAGQPSSRREHGELPEIFESNEDIFENTSKVNSSKFD